MNFRALWLLQSPHVFAFIGYSGSALVLLEIILKMGIDTEGVLSPIGILGLPTWMPINSPIRYLLAVITEIHCVMYIIACYYLQEARYKKKLRLVPLWYLMQTYIVTYQIALLITFGREYSAIRLNLAICGVGYNLLILTSGLCTLNRWLSGNLFDDDSLHEGRVPDNSQYHQPDYRRNERVGSNRSYDVGVQSSSSHREMRRRERRPSDSRQRARKQHRRSRSRSRAASDQREGRQSRGQPQRLRQLDHDRTRDVGSSSSRLREQRSYRAHERDSQLSDSPLSFRDRDRDRVRHDRDRDRVRHDRDRDRVRRDRDRDRDRVRHDRNRPQRRLRESGHYQDSRTMERDRDYGLVPYSDTPDRRQNKRSGDRERSRDEEYELDQYDSQLSECEFDSDSKYDSA